MIRWRTPNLALLVTLTLGCGDDRKGHDASDSADTADAADAADVTPDSAPDAPETVDDGTDTPDTAETNDTPDTPETPETNDTSDADVPFDVDDHGFHIRVPQSHSVPSEDFEGTIRVVDRMDIDHVCALTIDGVETILYVQATPLRCRDFGGCDYEVVGAFTTVAGGPSNAPLAGVTYDYGGNHHNDSISLPSAEGMLKVYHSSFGFGWRACHPPDCVQVLDGGTVIADGCTPERTRPAICVLIGDDGSEPPLVDTFEPCPGDPNRP